MTIAPSGPEADIYLTSNEEDYPNDDIQLFVRRIAPLIDTVAEVHHDCFIHEIANALHKSLMGRVGFDVVVPVLN